MGVVYKLTEDVVSFIIERKQETPRLSCREIAGLVHERHQKVVSKSSVHDVLKEHGVVIPRGRKPKIKFQIPPEKKQQLFANVVPGVIFQLPAPPPKPVQQTPNPVVRGEIQERMGEIFIKAVFWDIFPRPLWGIKKLEDIKSLNLNNLQEEWGYISTAVEGLKIDLQDGSCVEMDSRFQVFGPGKVVFPASIERCTQDAADRILNNINPLCIRSTGEGVTDAAILNFFHACEGTAGKGMRQVSLLGAGGVILAQFACFPRQKKDVILGMPRRLEVEQNDHKFRYFDLQVDGYDKNMSILSNFSPHVSNDEIVRIFKDRHPPVKLNFSLPLCGEGQGGGDITDQPAWILARLKARARVFFPSDFGQDAFESVLALKGVIEQGKLITLLTPVSYAYSALLRQAADNVNALNIRDENGQRVLCRIASENNANF